MPKVVSWQAGPPFSDARRQLMLGWEEGPVFKGTVQSQIWICDVRSGNLLDQAFTKERLAPYYAPVTLLPGDERALVSVVLDGKGRLFNMRLDGSNPREVTTPADGYSYGFAVTPAGRKLAFHTTGPRPLNYHITVSDLDGGRPVSIASEPAHLYFGPVWSPDGASLLFLDCHSRTDPGHDWADLCVAKADGSSNRVATSGQCLWFASSYGAFPAIAETAQSFQSGRRTAR
jgi:TolB protein